MSLTSCLIDYTNLADALIEKAAGHCVMADRTKTMREIHKRTTRGITGTVPDNLR